MSEKVVPGAYTFRQSRSAGVMVTVMDLVRWWRNLVPSVGTNIEHNGGSDNPPHEISAINPGTTTADLVAIGVRFVIVATLSDRIPPSHRFCCSASIAGTVKQLLHGHGFCLLLPTGEVCSGGVVGDHGSGAFGLDQCSRESADCGIVAGIRSTLFWVKGAEHLGALLLLL